MTDAVGKTTDTMKVMEKHLPPEKLARNLEEFVKAQERLGVTDEACFFREIYKIPLVRFSSFTIIVCIC